MYLVNINNCLLMSFIVYSMVSYRLIWANAVKAILNITILTSTFGQIKEVIHRTFMTHII